MPERETELIQKMWRHSRLLSECREMAEAVDNDEEVICELEQMGYSRETVRLVLLVPLVQVAWADGEVTGRERNFILEVARLRGIEQDGPVRRQLVNWLDHRPSEEFFQATLRFIGRLLEVLPMKERTARKRALISYCTRVAAASGGVLGLGRRISPVERTLLEHMGDDLDDHQEETLDPLADNCLC